MIDVAKFQKAANESVAADVRRIIAMDMTHPLTDVEIDAVSYHYIKPDQYRRGKRLLPKQAEAMIAWNDVGGALCAIEVGGGKTLTTLLIADDCNRETIKYNMSSKVPRNPRYLLLVPSPVIPQFRDTDIDFARRLTRFETHVHFVSGATRAQHLRVARSRRRGLYVMSYSILSSPTAQDLLDAIEPSCIICDEAHQISGIRQSARAKRFWNYVDAHAPAIVALSGTMTRKSPMEYYRLAKASLGNNNFLPNSRNLAEAWGALIDSAATDTGQFRPGAVPQAGPIQPLRNWAHEKYPEETVTDDTIGFRKAFYLRFYSTPGVVPPSENSLPFSLHIHNREIPDRKERPGWDMLQGHVRSLKDEYLTPGGEEINHAMHLWKWRYELEGAGIYNEQYWPEVEVVARRKQVPNAEAKEILERSQEHHQLRQEYVSALNKWLRNNSRPKLDTPFLVGGDMSRHGDKNVGPGLYRVWRAAKDAEFEDMIKRDKRCIRVCDFKVNACMEDTRVFLNENKGHGRIIWYHNEGVGEWVHEVLNKAGIDNHLVKAGRVYNEFLKDSAKLKGRVICCSIRAHGTGKNLQHGFWNSYYLQWPRDATTAEQSLGRTHRTGQPEDTVVAVTCNTGEFDRVNFAATLNDSAYVSQTQGRQKLMYASYDPVPVRVPYAVLHEWQMQPEGTSTEAEELLSKFKVM